MKPLALVIWPSLVCVFPHSQVASNFALTTVVTSHFSIHLLIAITAKVDFIDCHGVVLLKPFHSSTPSWPQHHSQCHGLPLPLPGAVVLILWLWQVPLLLLALVLPQLPLVCKLPNGFDPWYG